MIGQAGIGIPGGQAVLRLLMATLLAGIVGVQREWRGHDAGARTHALLALGAGLFGVLSVSAFAALQTGAPTNVRIDVTRVASYVAAGVGFLAGGVIVKQDDRVRGLTTATSLWVAAAIGLSAGLGAYLPAVVATVVTVLCLEAARPLEHVATRHRPRTTLTLVTAADEELFERAEELIAAARRRGASRHATLRIARDPADEAVVTVEIGGVTEEEARRFALEVARRPAVRSCEVSGG